MIVLVAVALELVLMFNRFIFLNCLVYLLTLAVFILNFFERSCIRFCIVALVLSILLDTLWFSTAANVSQTLLSCILIQSTQASTYVLAGRHKQEDGYGNLPTLRPYC